MAEHAQACLSMLAECMGHGSGCLWGSGLWAISFRLYPLGYLLWAIFFWAIFFRLYPLGSLLLAVSVSIFLKLSLLLTSSFCCPCHVSWKLSPADHLLLVVQFWVSPVENLCNNLFGMYFKSSNKHSIMLY